MFLVSIKDKCTCHVYFSPSDLNLQVSSGQNPGYVLYIGDDTNQLDGDYNRKLSGSLLTNVYNGMS